MRMQKEKSMTERKYDSFILGFLHGKIDMILRLKLSDLKRNFVRMSRIMKYIVEGPNIEILMKRLMAKN